MCVPTDREFHQRCVRYFKKGTGKRTNTIIEWAIWRL